MTEARVMKVGIGWNQATDGWTAGREIVQSARVHGTIQDPNLAIAFCSSPVDANAFLAGIQSSLGPDIPVVGGSAMGLITNETICYQGCISGILLIEAPDTRISIAAAHGLYAGEEAVGRALARQLPSDPSGVTLLFYDTVRVGPTPDSPPIINSSRALLRGIEEGLGSRLPIFGAGVVGDVGLSPTIQFIGDRVATQSAAAIALRGGLELDWCIMHGCTLKDGVYHRITKCEGAVIHELDGRPIVGVIDAMYGSTDWRQQMPLKRLTIGVNHGERFPKTFREEDYVNRLILGLLPDESGVMIFEPDLEVGTEIQFMLRDSRKIVESVRVNAEAVLRRMRRAGQTPVLGFYIDCAGRNAQFSESLQEESAELQEVFNQAGIPLFGFFSGVEIAPFETGNRGLDWTGVLVVFASPRHG
jgi:hypothetical protein